MKALITGASSGIGYSMAKYLDSLGYDLVLVARNKDKLESISKTLKNNVQIICMDLTITDNCIELYKALHILTKLYLKDMIDRDKGNILNVASIAGFMPGPLLDTYYATKGYVVRLSQGIREELRRKKSNVRISILCPGPVETNFDNVAGVKFSLKGMNSDYVAKYAIDKMIKGKFIIIPGFSIKCLKFVSKIVPDCLLVRFVFRAQKKKC